MLEKIVALIFLVGGAFAINTTVTVGKLGKVIGTQETTAWTNRTIFSFNGMPYAQPPINNLRFKPPVSVTSWNGTLNATQFGNACSQSKKYLPSSIVDSEDCLTLNVYVPKVANATATLPVMIYLHGGAFKGAWASLYKPNYILEEDVILVVPQFRLGPLGLLCLQTDDVPGNVQFLDQIMAMKWVQDNIGYFGGNANQVTLFGQSSGAASVNLHQFSPLSKGLFHRGIMLSGSAFAPWVMDYRPRNTATKLGALVGCNHTSVAKLATCFKGLPARTIVDGFETYLDTYTIRGLQRIGGHRAVIQTAGTQKFLVENPSTLLARSEYTRMPMIGGNIRDEGDWPLSLYYSSYLLSQGLVNNSDFLTYNLTSFLISRMGVNDATGGVAHTFTKAYFNESELGDFTKMLPGILDILGDLAFKAPVFKMMQANSQLAPSYLYSFRYYGANSLGSSFGLPFRTGVGHGKDLDYIFPSSTLSSDDLIVAKRMVSLFTSFAITGEPSADDTTWEPMNTAFGPYLKIDGELSTGDDFLAEYTISEDEGLTP